MTWCGLERTNFSSELRPFLILSHGIALNLRRAKPRRRRSIALLLLDSAIRKLCESLQRRKTEPRSRSTFFAARELDSTGRTLQSYTVMAGTASSRAPRSPPPGGSGSHKEASTRFPISAAAEKTERRG